LHSLGATNSDNALDRHFPVSASKTVWSIIDHILIVNRPDSLAGRYRVQVMDMGTDIACRMHAIKLVHFDIVSLGHGNVRAGLAGHKHFAVGQAGDNSQAFFKSLAIFADDNGGV